ncbi:hypothetical protein O6V14_18835 [Sphingomonas faeni]|uniref:hypothetical protein n=1 Tax=Sphingomonas faeni TaxID=185950 RepID=UPI003344ECC5
MLVIASHSPPALRTSASRGVSRAVVLLASVISLAACNAAPKPADVKGKPDREAVAEDLTRLDAGVRIAAANKRIDELERQVGELQSTPEKLDLELLTNRVTALEVQASAAASQASVAPPKDTPKDAPAAARTTSRDAQQSEYARQPAKRTPKLTLPELESRPRLATPTEARAFTPHK